MPAEKILRDFFSLFKTTYAILCRHPNLLSPLIFVLFIHLFILEILYFAPRYPLSIFFGPIIIKLEGLNYLDYPYHFILLTKWFQKLQIPIWVIFTSFFLGVMINIIEVINSDKKLKISNVYRQTLASYVHIFFMSSIILACVRGLIFIYGLMIKRAALIRSEEGIYYILKRLVLEGTPYAFLFFSIVVTTIFAFVLPIIILEKRKFYSAFILNFRYLWGSFWRLFFTIFLVHLLYVPIIILTHNRKLFEHVLIPDMWLGIVIAGIGVMLIIDGFVYTAITTEYLMIKESREDEKN